MHHAEHQPRRNGIWILRWVLQILALAGLWGCSDHEAGAQGGTKPAQQAGDLAIRFIDVGQGDAVLVTAGGQAILIDAGRGDDIVLVLREYGVDSLVAAIASHNHQDHIGGMDAVIADFPIGHYVYNGRAPENRNAVDVQRWLARKGVVRQLPPWGPIHLGDATVRVFPSPLSHALDDNNASVAVLIERGSFRALLTGDSQVEELSGWLAAGLPPRVTLLKAAHHGARNGVTPGWLERTNPEVVVVSVGATNAYGHPEAWALRYYGAHHRKVYRTDIDGTVTVLVSSSGGYRIETSGPTAH